MHTGGQFLEEPVAVGWSMPGFPADFSVPETGAAPGVGQPRTPNSETRPDGLRPPDPPVREWIEGRW